MLVSSLKKSEFRRLIMNLQLVARDLRDARIEKEKEQEDKEKENKK